MAITFPRAGVVFLAALFLVAFILSTHFLVSKLENQNQTISDLQTKLRTNEADMRVLLTDVQKHHLPMGVGVGVSVPVPSKWDDYEARVAAREGHSHSSDPRLAGSKSPNFVVGEQRSRTHADDDDDDGDNDASDTMFKQRFKSKRGLSNDELEDAAKSMINRLANLLQANDGLFKSDDGSDGDGDGDSEDKESEPVVVVEDDDDSATIDTERLKAEMRKPVDELRRKQGLEPDDTDSVEDDDKEDSEPPEPVRTKPPPLLRQKAFYNKDGIVPGADAANDYPTPKSPQKSSDKSPKKDSPKASDDGDDDDDDDKPDAAEEKDDEYEPNVDLEPGAGDRKALEIAVTGSDGQTPCSRHEERNRGRVSQA